MRMRAPAAAAFAILFFVGSAHAQYLEVNLSAPDPEFALSASQNGTFLMNATVYCRSVVGCGDVNGTARYNSSSPTPDVQMNRTQGLPFFTSGVSAMLPCPSNPLSDGEFCNVTWAVNATGAQGTSWKVGALFNSSLSPVVQDNHTGNATVTIATCGIGYTMHWGSIVFGEANPGTENMSAPGNAGDEYNLTVDAGSCAADFYINSTDLRNVTYSTNVSASNVSWSNVSSDIDAGFFRMSGSPSSVVRNVFAGSNVTTWYWLSVPPAFAGVYNATIYIMGVVHDEAPP